MRIELIQYKKNKALVASKDLSLRSITTADRCKQFEESRTKFSKILCDRNGRDSMIMTKKEACHYVLHYQYLLFLVFFPPYRKLQFFAFLPGGRKVQKKHVSITHGTRKNRNSEAKWQLGSNSANCHGAWVFLFLFFAFLMWLFCHPKESSTV